MELELPFIKFLCDDYRRRVDGVTEALLRKAGKSFCGDVNLSLRRDENGDYVNLPEALERCDNVLRAMEMMLEEAVTGTASALPAPHFSAFSAEMQAAFQEAAEEYVRDFPLVPRITFYRRDGVLRVTVTPKPPKERN